MQWRLHEVLPSIDRENDLLSNKDVILAARVLKLTGQHVFGLDDGLVLTVCAFDNYHTHFVRKKTRQYWYNVQVLQDQKQERQAIR